MIRHMNDGPSLIGNNCVEFFNDMVVLVVVILVERIARGEGVLYDWIMIYGGS